MNIYAYVYVMHLLGKLVGMAPYQVTKHKKSYFCKTSKKCTANFIIIALATTIITVRYIVIVTTTYENPDAKKGDLVLVYIDGFRILNSISTIIIFALKQTQFVTAYKKIYHCDLKLQHLGRPTSYLKHVSISIFVFVLTVTYGYLAYDVHIKSTPGDFLLEKTSMFLHASIQNLALQYFCCYTIVVYEKFTVVNSKLVDFNETCEIKDAGCLKVFAETYGNLCCGMKCLNEVFSVTLFCEIIFSLCQSLQILYMIFVEGNSSCYLILWIVRNVIVLVVITFPPALVTYEMRRISRYLGDMDVSYTDEEAAITKNSFLLEILQNTVNIKCVFFDISLSQLFNQVTVCISVLLFIYQLVEVKVTP